MLQHLGVSSVSEPPATTVTFMRKHKTYMIILIIERSRNKEGGREGGREGGTGDGRTDARTHGRTEGGREGRTDGRTHGRTDKMIACMGVRTCGRACLRAYT